MDVSKINKFSQRKLETILKTENHFISNLFSILALPQNNHKDEELDEEEPPKNPPLPTNKTSRATSLVDLQNRIQKLKSKTNTYKEKVQKKNLKNRLKKKIKQEKRNRIHKQAKTEKSENIKTENANNQNTLVFNRDDKIVFSKIDFTGLGKETNKKAEKNPKKLLEQVEQVNDKIRKLKDSGETQKAKEIKEKTIWRNALAKAEGIKVKDDPVLLKKSIQKQGQKKRSSKRKWENRIEKVKNAKDEKQKKRTENIEKRKKEKKLHKLKKAAKKGKIIPGF